MIRVLAIAAFIASIILFAIGLILALSSDPTTAANGGHWVDGGFITTAAGLLCLALDGVPVRTQT